MWGGGGGRPGPYHAPLPHARGTLGQLVIKARNLDKQFQQFDSHEPTWPFGRFNTMPAATISVLPTEHQLAMHERPPELIQAEIPPCERLSSLRPALRSPESGGAPARSE
jgi:hypothetical protein